MKAVGHKAIIFLLKVGTPFPKNTMFLSGSSCLCRQGALLLFTSLWGQGQPKELPAGLNVLVMFFLNHYCLRMKVAQGWISVSQPHPKESACRQAPCPLLFSEAVTSKATISMKHFLYGLREYSHHLPWFPPRSWCLLHSWEC